LDDLGLNEGIDNHLTVMVPGTRDRFLCISYGLAWSEVTASKLLLLDASGNVLDGAGAPDPTAFYIHARVHAANPNASALLHTHMPAATALCCLEDMELKLIHQNACRFRGQIAYDDDYRGLVLDASEGDRLAKAMGDKRVLMCANHGVLVAGRSVAEAFDELYYLERAAELQCKVMSTGAPTTIIDAAVAEAYAAQADEFRGCWADKHFAARKRTLMRPSAFGNVDFAS